MTRKQRRLTLIGGALVVLAIAVPLLIPAIRKPLITAPALGFLRRGSLGRKDATGRGVFVTAVEAARHLGIQIADARVAVQGFGNVTQTCCAYLGQIDRIP